MSDEERRPRHSMDYGPLVENALSILRDPYLEDLAQEQFTARSPDPAPAARALTRLWEEHYLALEEQNEELARDLLERIHRLDHEHMGATGATHEDCLAYQRDAQDNIRRRRAQARIRNSYSDMLNQYSQERVVEAVRSSPRLAQNLRPYQEEINRVANQLAQNQAILGHSALRVTFNEEAPEPGVQVLNPLEENQTMPTSTPEPRPTTPRIRAHLKRRDGWTRVMEIDDTGAVNIQIPFRSSPGARGMVEEFRSDPASSEIQRLHFRLVKTVTTRDHRTGSERVERWYEEA